MKRCIKKAKYGLQVGSNYESAGDALNIPLYAGIGYYQGTQLAQGLGLDENAQTTFGRMSAVNAGLGSASVFLDGLWKRKEAKENQAYINSLDYINQPRDQYAYNPNLYGPQQSNYFQAGGMVRESLNVAQPLPYNDLIVKQKPLTQPTWLEKTTDYLGFTDNQSFYNKLNEGEARANLMAKPLLGKSTVAAYNRSSVKMQEGGEVDFYDTMPEQVVYDSRPKETMEEPMQSNPYTRRVSEEVEVNPISTPVPTGKGSIAVTHNNPGNIKYGKYAKRFNASPGRKATDGGQFAVFPDVATGLAAQRKLLLGRTYKNLTVANAMKTWSNQGYGGEIYPAIANKKMAELTEQELAELQRRQIKREDATMYNQIYGQGK